MGAIATITKALGFPGRAANSNEAPRARSGYMRDGRGMVFSRWLPSLRSAQHDVAASWEAAAARTLDLAHNSGWISGMMDQAAVNTVGLGMRLRPMPENGLFAGMPETKAQEWRQLVAARWELWANNRLECDIEGTRTIAEMTDAAFRHWLATGEILAELVFRVRPESKSRLKVRLLPATRILNKTQPFDRIFGGVKVDTDGMPVAFLTRRHDPLLGHVEEVVAARDTYGRPKVIHVFVGAPGQRRGITVLVPALKVAKQFDQLADATLLSAIIQTVFSASITSSAPTEEALRALLSPQEQAKLQSQGGSPFDAWFEAQAGWSEGHPIDVGYAGRIAHMFPGEKLEFHTAKIEASTYKDFPLHLLRELARCFGLTYESATLDYSGATYSSVQAATTEVFQITRARRKFILVPFLQPIYSTWLEDEIANGTIWFPGGVANFQRNRDAAARATWSGDPKPVADELKAAKTRETYQSMGVMSDTAIANDMGVDIEDVYAERAHEAALRKEYGLPENKTVATIEAQAPNSAMAAPADDTPDQEEDPADGNNKP